MNQYQINAVFGMPTESGMKYLDYVLGGLEYDVESNSIINQARTFRIANLSRLDIAQDILNGLKSSFENRTGFKGFKKELTATLKKKGWWDTDEIIDQETGEVIEKKNGKKAGNSHRLKSIYNNMIDTMNSVGRYTAMTNVAWAFPYWQYNAVMDIRTREEHGKLNGKIFRYDDPIWEIIFPPNGFNCRCSVQSYSEEEIKEKNLTVLKSTGQSAYEVTDYIDENGNPVKKKVTGVTFIDENGKEVVFYPDKRFDNNPAKTFYQVDLDNYNTKLAQQYVDAELKSPVANMMYRNAVNNVTTQDTINVAVLHEKDQAEFSLNQKVIMLSQKTLNLIVNSQSFLLKDFNYMQHIILNADLVLSYSHSICFCLKLKGGWRVIDVGRSGNVKIMTDLSDAEFDLFAKSVSIIRGQYE